MNKYNQNWVSFLFRRLNWAITLGQTSYFSVPEFLVSPEWHGHEDCHKRQWAREGRIKFALTYLWYQIKYGYDNNPFEIEARYNEKSN